MKTVICLFCVLLSACTPRSAEWRKAAGDFRRNPTTPTRASMAFSAGDFEFEPYEAFFPIPSRELRLNPALKQTEGYD
jgi:hypothetical protein